jgi:protein subunit release factor A
VGRVLRAQIRSNGGLANYSANNANLSDRNAKKDISPAADTWNCLKEWEIVNYRYKDQSADADLNLGVIAQQVAESCPEVITVFQEAKEATEDQPAQEKRLGVKEQQMYWMAIKALQEAQVRIEQLEQRLKTLVLKPS